MARPNKAQKRKAKLEKTCKAEATAEQLGHLAAKRHLRDSRQELVHTRPLPRILSDLDAQLRDEKGQLRVLPSKVYADIDPMDLRIWCNRRAIYGLPTTELIDWLREFIGDRTAIEVCSGNGVFGRALDIPRTDNWLQADNPEVILTLMAQKQPLVEYGTDVEKLEAVEAVRKYDPQVVIGSWVTHWIDPHKPMPLGGGSIYGPRENRILNHPSVEAYVVIGNTDTHGHKPLLKREHRIVQGPWIHSRARQPENNALFVWGS